MSIMPRMKNGNDLISELYDKRIVYINGAIGWAMSQVVIAQLLLLDDGSDKEVNFYIQSNGGCIHSGFAIYDTLQQLSVPVNHIGMGMCASMGAFLLSTGKEGHRFSTKRNQIMLHQASAGSQGNVQDMAINQRHVEKLNDMLFIEMAERAGIPKKKLMKLAERDLWLQPEDALKLNLIDKIL